MSTQSPAAQAISEKAREEGGPTKGSESAQMQSQVTKQRNAEQANEQVGAKLKRDSVTSDAQAQSQAAKEANFEQAAQEVGSKMQNDPSSVTAQDAQYLQSREHRAIGGVQVPSDSIAAEAQRLASANEQGRPVSGTGATSTANNDGGLDPAEQSRRDREGNLQEAIDSIKPKIDNDPGSVTKDDANLLHSREMRAHGVTEKGGIAAQAQSLADKNESA